MRRPLRRPTGHAPATRASPLHKKNRSRMRKRLWLATGAIAVFLLTLFAAAKIVHPNDRDTTGQLPYGHDFIGFYTAGRAIHEGRWQDVYRPDVELAHGQATLRDNNVDFKMPYSGWLYPPFVAPFYSIFATTDYRSAVWRWTGFSIL